MLENSKACFAKKTSIGGQALIEGIMMRGPKKTAMAVRNPQGDIVLEKWDNESEGKKPSIIDKLKKIPVVRGVFNFATSMITGYKSLMKSAEIAGFEDETEKENSKACFAKKTSIGGQALIEGIMMRGPKMTAMAVRNPQGEIVLEKWENESADKKPSIIDKLKEIPIVRGVFNFATAMISGYKSLMKSAEIAGFEDEEEKKESKGLMAVVGVVASVIGVLLSVVLFIFLPALIYDLLSMLIPFLVGKAFIKSLFEGVFKIVILVGYMALVSRMNDIKRTFQYHGAEHKTIFCYEAGLELTVENVKKMGRFHPRCGTSFLIVMVIVGVFIGLLIPAGLPTIVRTLIKLLLLPITMGIGYEFIKFAGKHENSFTRILSAPGLWMQRITVLEPDDSMIECAIAAVNEVIPDDGSDLI